MTGIVRNAVWLAADKVFRLGLGLVLTILIARQVGPESFGVLSLCMSVVALLGALGNLGLQSLIIRDLSRHPAADHGALLGSALTLRLIGSGAALLLSVISILVLRGGDEQALLIALLLTLAVIPQSLDLVESVMLSRGQVGSATISRGVAFCGGAALRVFLLWKQADIAWFAFAVLVESVLSGIGFWVVSRWHHLRIDARAATRGRLKSLLRDCASLTTAMLSVQIYMRIDQVMISHLLGDRAAGLFSAAVRISETWYFLPVSLVAAASPALSRSLLISDQAFETAMRRTIGTITWFGLGCACLLCLFAEQITQLLYGAAYAEAASVIRIHAWAGVFVAAGVASGPYFVNKNLLHTAMLQTFASAAINVLLNLMLIPKFGIIGAAYSTVIAQACSALILNSFFPTTRPLFHLQLSSIGGKR